MVRGLRIALAVATVTIATAGCSENVFEPDVLNQPDDFQFKLEGADQVTESQTMMWRNNGVLASVSQDSRISHGSAHLVVRDADGTQVYSRSLAERDTFVTEPVGTPGIWTLQLQLSDVSGDVVFRMQRLDARR